MNNNRLTASKSKAALEEQSYDLIQQHIIDPENSPLPEHLRVQCNRVSLSGIASSKVISSNGTTPRKCCIR